MPTTPAAPCRCATAYCHDCLWTGLAVEWPDHHTGHPRHHFGATSPFCGETPCRTVAAEQRAEELA